MDIFPFLSLSVCSYKFGEETSRKKKVWSMARKLETAERVFFSLKREKGEKKQERGCLSL